MAAALSDSSNGKPASGVLQGSASDQNQIEFLCPNNHLLHGPASLQGRPGQCPECGSKFRIPSYEDDLDDRDAIDSELGLATVDDSSTVPGGLEGSQGLGIAFGRRASPSSSSASAMPSETKPSASFASLFSRIWACKPENAVLEIHFGEGRPLVPHQYAKSLSTSSHAVFAVGEPDGTFTMTAIAWHSITSVVVRGMKELPDGGWTK
jgi:hypothetical protein